MKYHWFQVGLRINLKIIKIIYKRKDSDSIDVYFPDVYINILRFSL